MKKTHEFTKTTVVINRAAES